ncbi:MAG: hypothetical protein V4654_09090 [Bdellovibrionota bacterium]
MKSLIALFIIGSSVAANASDIKLKCDVVNLHDDNVFEEGLGETGDSNADEDSQAVSVEIGESSKDVSIGQHSFSSDDKDMKISRKDSSALISINVQMGKVQTIKVKVYKKSLLGVILQKDSGINSYHTVAEIDCNDYTKTKELILSGKVASKEIDKATLQKAILQKISNIDIAFELGDGYYDLKSEKLMELSLDGKVVGYELQSNLSYTEGDDAETYTYFLANGVRFSGPGN